MIVNCTPHPVTVAGITIPPSGILPRAAETTTQIGTVDLEGVTVPIVTKQYGQVRDLPAPAPDTLLIVSALVAKACPDRSDLVVPADLVRDESGRPVGCQALARI